MSDSGGECGALVDSIDWSSTPLGAREAWPTSLSTLVGVLLRSLHPMLLWWGPELIQFYNDAFVPSLGAGKHPAAIGQAGRACWNEAWSVVGAQLDDAMHGTASCNVDQLVPSLRNERLEEVYWTYSYSPVVETDGHVAGVLVVCSETTARVLLDRRLVCLRRLGQLLSACEDVKLLGGLALEVAATAPRDVKSLRQIPSTAAPYEPEANEFAVRSAVPAVGTFVFGLGEMLPFDAAYRAFLHDFVAEIETAATRIDARRARAEAFAERRNLLLQAPVPMALLAGPDLVFELANQRYVEMVGREVQGKRYTQAFPEVEGTDLLGKIQQAYRAGTSYAEEECLLPLDRRGNGVFENAYFEFTAHPVRDGSGDVYGLVFVAVDVTAQVTSRLELETHDHERSQLIARLEAAGRAKDAFLATVSHELRTPLSAILGWARMLRSGHVPPEKQARALEVIERNSLVQAQLIEDLLDVSRIISGKLRLDVQPLVLAPVVEAAVESMQHALDAKALQFSCVLDPEAGHLVGDGHRLQQVIWNLLSNAVKFTPKGGSVRLEVTRVHSGIQIAVTDSGQGIAADLLGTVFERFEQVDASTQRMQGGLGLGLAITRHLVELHGGSVEVQSEGQGRGSTFLVKLPVSPFRERDGSPFRQPIAHLARPELEHPSELQGLTILVVDDEPDTRELLAEVLQQMGSSVLLAASAGEALAILDEASPRVIVCDIGMPDMDGYQFVQALRARPADRGGRTVALALTAYAGAEDRRRALRAGFQMHLAKPVEPAELVAVLANLAQLALAMG